MIIAFAQTGTNSQINLFLDSVAGHELWHITDEVTEGLPGCKVFRHTKGRTPFILWRARAYAAFGKPAAYLDTDIIVRHDLSPIMDLDFDIALTKTKAVVKDPLGANITEIMPYNGGVMFIKNQQFLQDVADSIEKMAEDKQKWYGDQIALKSVSPKYNMIELPNSIYNYKPKRADVESKTLPESAWVIHFKGELLKQFMSDFQQ
jgi:hypothetical protein